jgi:hypothetical protein
VGIQDQDRAGWHKTIQKKDCCLWTSQIPGINFNLTHSPVATDMLIQILLGLAVYHKEGAWETKMLDIEAAFL